MTDTRSRLATAAVAAIAVLVLLLGAAALLPGLLDDDSVPAPPATPTAPGREEPAAAPEAVPTPLTTAPTGVTWELFEGVALPTSRTDGPARTDGPVHAGYSRTPTGALLADAQITYRSLVDPDLTSLRQVAQAQLVDGPGKTAYLNLLGRLEENEPPATGYAQIVGFRFITFTPDLAVISLATRGDSGAIQVSTDTLRWVDGDWRLDLPASGLQQPQVVQDLSGYVPWSGVS